MLSLHQIAAVTLKTPELAIDATEAESLANGIAKVARHYNVKASAIATDWVNLAMVLMMVYGSRIMAIKVKRSQSSIMPDSNVTPFNPMMFQGS